ncbi:MAG: hypothetical protein ACKO4L_15310, partial [Nodosilinea sp.]
GGGLAAGTLQAAWLGTGWAVAGAYTRNQAGAFDSSGMTPLALQSWPQPLPGRGGSVDSWGISGFWQLASQPLTLSSPPCRSGEARPTG